MNRLRKVLQLEDSPPIHKVTSSSLCFRDFVVNQTCPWVKLLRCSETSLPRWFRAAFLLGPLGPEHVYLLWILTDPLIPHWFFIPLQLSFGNRAFYPPV